jgi:hypothetical protein
MRRVGGLMAYGETDPEAEALQAEFTRGLSELGSTDGRNLRLDVRPDRNCSQIEHNAPGPACILYFEALLHGTTVSRCHHVPRLNA